MTSRDCIECQLCHAEAEKERKKNVVIDENVNEILIFCAFLHIYGVHREEGETQCSSTLYVWIYNFLSNKNSFLFVIKSDTMITVHCRNQSRKWASITTTTRVEMLYISSHRALLSHCHFITTIDPYRFHRQRDH